MSEPAVKKERTPWFTAARVLYQIATHTIFPTRTYGRAYTHMKAPYIIVSNHKHWFDPLLVGGPIKDYEVRFLGKKELVKSRIGRWMMAKLHMIVVDRHNSDLKAMRDCVNVIRQGHVLGIFPEGTRCRDTIMEHMETGCAFIALRCKVPLLPVRIERPCRLFRMTRVTYGPPIDISDLVEEGISNETAEKLNARIRDAILALGPH